MHRTEGQPSSSRTSMGHWWQQSPSPSLVQGSSTMYHFESHPSLQFRVTWVAKMPHVHLKSVSWKVTVIMVEGGAGLPTGRSTRQCGEIWKLYGFCTSLFIILNKALLLLRYIISKRFLTLCQWPHWQHGLPSLHISRKSMKRHWDPAIYLTIATHHHLFPTKHHICGPLQAVENR